MDRELEILKQYVLISKYRHKVMDVLTIDTVKIPKQISMETGIRKNHISKVLKELKEQNLIECLNENSKKGRLYCLTSIGNEVKNELKPTSQRYLETDDKIYDSKVGRYLYIEDIVDLLNSQDKTITEYYNLILSS